MRAKFALVSGALGLLIVLLLWIWISSPAPADESAGERVSSEQANVVKTDPPESAEADRRRLSDPQLSVPRELPEEAAFEDVGEPDSIREANPEVRDSLSSDINPNQQLNP